VPVFFALIAVKSAEYGQEREIMPDKPKTFQGTPPTPQHARIVEELEAEEKEKIKEIKEEAKQEVLEKVVEEVENPPKPLEWWIHWGLFWGMMGYIFIISIIPVFRTIKYNTINKTEIQFAKEKPELVKAMKDYRDARIKETDEKIISAFR